MDYPKPQIGYYQAECCLLDLYKIDTQEGLNDALERIEDNDECGPLMVFSNLAEAIAYLSDDGLTPEEEAREFARLGWVVPNGWKISTFARVRQGKEDST